MSVKDKVLNILEQNREQSFSGELLANQLSVSRAAVWKAIQSLKAEGFQIEAVTNKGYRLLSGSDVFTAEGIRIFLDKPYQKNEIIVFKSIDSTNKEAKRRSLEGEKHGTLIIAEEQTGGRGRLGREFVSPSGTGIYMSMILRPKMDLSNAVMITTAASVAVCRAIRGLTNLEPTIKWVNDIYLNDKKVCGILTEAVSDFESGVIDNIILGIGVNFKTRIESLPEELQSIAGSLFTEFNICITRNQLAAEIYNEFMEILQNIEKREFLSDYKKWSNVLGKEVRFLQNDVWVEGVAYDIEKDGGLLVRNKEGKTYALRTGEITLRRK